MSMNGHDALHAIQQTMSGERWSPDTLEAIAEIMTAAGYPLDDPSEEDDGCPVGDPECLGNNGDCHDACEASRAA